MNARELDGGAECLLFLCLSGGFLHLICLFCCCLLYLQTQGECVQLDGHAGESDFWASFLCDFLYFQEVCKIGKDGIKDRFGNAVEGSGGSISVQVSRLRKDRFIF